MKKIFNLLLTLCCFSGAMYHSSLLAKGPDQLKVIYDINLNILDKKVVLPWGKDPFAESPGFTSFIPAKVKLELNAIFYNLDEKIAIINDKELYEGSTIEDYNITTIGKNYVILRHDSSLIQLTLPSTDMFNPEIIIEESLQQQPQDEDNNDD